MFKDRDNLVKRINPEISGGILGLSDFLGEVGGVNKDDSLTANSLAGLDIGGAITQENTGDEIEIEFFGGLEEEAGLGFSARAILGKMGNYTFGVVGAVIYFVDFGIVLV